MFNFIFRCYDLINSLNFSAGQVFRGIDQKDLIGEFAAFCLVRRLRILQLLQHVHSICWGYFPLISGLILGSLS